MPLRLVIATREQVSAFVSKVHRHHDPSPGDVFRLAVADESGVVHGVASVGRPPGPRSDDKRTLEVTRVATDGTPNACSILYGAARRIAWTLGYRRIITYTLPEEGGASLRASGWAEEGEAGQKTGTGWNSRPGRTEKNKGLKTRWACYNPDYIDATWPEQQDDGQIGLFTFY
jgi:hypothetical protein